MTGMSVQVRVLVALWFVYFTNYIDRVAISIAGPAMMESLKMSPTQFGLVLSSFGVGYFLAQIPGGLIADRWGVRIALFVSPILWALFTGLTGLVTTVVGLVVVRFCFGLAEGMSQGPTYKAIGNGFSSAQRARALAIVVSSSLLAPAIAGAIIGYLIVNLGWQTMFFILAVPAAFAGIASYVLIPAKHGMAKDNSGQVSEDTPQEHVTFRQLFSRPSLWLLSLSQFGYNFVTWGYSGWLPSYLALARDIDLKSVGAISSIPYIFGFFGLMTGGWLGSGIFHRFRPQLVAACYILAGISIFVAYHADTLVASLAGLSGTSFFLYAGYGPKGAVMLDLAPGRLQAAFVGVVSTFGQAAAVVAPAAIGFLVGATGTFGAGFGLMIAALSISAISLLILAPNLSKQNAAA